MCVYAMRHENNLKKLAFNRAEYQKIQYCEKTRCVKQYCIYCKNVVDNKNVILYGWIMGALKKFLSVFDLRDVLVFGGIFLIGFGLYKVHPGAAFSTSGALLLLLGLGWLTRMPPGKK
jgi:hypothetical protein